MGFALRNVIVERLGRAGDGIAGDLRVPFTLPGERVRGPVEDNVLAPVQIVEGSTDRVVPPCPLFGTCGGCTVQHASDAFVADWKREVTLRALAARGLAARIGPVLTSPERSRVRAIFTGRRTRKTVAVGFHARRSDQVVDVTTCHVLRPEIMAARPALEALTTLGASRTHPVRLTVTVSDAGLDVDVAGDRMLDAGLLGRLAEVAEVHDLARLSWNGETAALRRPPAQSFGLARVVPPPGAFLQATAEGAAALVAAVRRIVGPARRVADLFAGCGTFALALADGAEVHAVEGDAGMLASLDAGWRGTPGLRRVTTETRDLFRRPLGPAELARFDAVVLDPPRAGAEAQARALASSRVARIAAVSCDPATFARDAQILCAGGYVLEEVTVVDQFRWSGHVELVATLVRQAAIP